MNTIEIPIKEYKQSLQVQKSILSHLDFLQKMVFESSRDEITPSAMRRLEKISSKLDKGAGKRFSTIASFKKYLKEI
ncbi:hypothetical protein A3J61_02445 [Candidatus Nomurabacteria bacterium RIFCSPHIGHO2_02_FULL_38_15]|uniref:Uncharacterized protein n=1 Tax=Candidatus Nomurabacteria bacterium RIFCSPHIGHO2_02_FULL_38_15 TaxID=1801752 RepID=A0A1F6VSP1_9BACT|nr:MAG: hypothetical protein A3J61_02445 [Candidatus Nomurabacteria bacterium RIFCSPHIGHO2_02_FULL_38_15]